MILGVFVEFRLRFDTKQASETYKCCEGDIVMWLQMSLISSKRAVKFGEIPVAVPQESILQRLSTEIFKAWTNISTYF